MLLLDAPLFPATATFPPTKYDDTGKELVDPGALPALPFEAFGPFLGAPPPPPPPLAVNKLVTLVAPPALPLGAGSLPAAFPPLPGPPTA